MTGNTSCKICNNLELGSGYLRIMVRDLVNSSSGCSACLMLSTVLQSWLKSSKSNSCLGLLAGDSGLKVWGYKCGKAMRVCLQSLESKSPGFSSGFHYS